MKTNYSLSEGNANLNEVLRVIFSETILSIPSQARRPFNQLILIGLTWAAFAVGAQAQTDFEIESSSPDIEQNYREELDKWMLRAYEGDRDAQFKVGVLFTNKQFDQPDYEQAVYWYKQAARQGHVLAQYNLGHQYLMGVGVKENQKTAMEWWLQAAEQDHALAQFNVGRAYYLGIGLPEDHKKSRYWFNRAADNQEPKSIEILQQLGWIQQQQAVTDSVNTASSGAAEAATETMQQETPAVPAEPTLVSKIVPAETADSDLSEDGSLTAADGSLTAADGSLTAADGSLPADGSLSSTDGSLSDEKSALNPIAEAQAADSAATEQVQEQPATPVLQAQITEKSAPAALYTNPKVRSVLISIVDDRSTLEIADRGEQWLTVTSKTGFPVWVHRDYISVSGDKGSITGNAVNARSVPIITNGTVVGRLEKNEKVKVLDTRKQWYRIVAPTRFKAWVKTEDFERFPVQKTMVVEAEADVNAPVDESSSAPLSTNKPKLTGPRPVNDNEWLYSQPNESFTLQLASFDDPEKIKEFVSRAKFADNPELHQFTSRGKGIQWTYFLYGSYTDKVQAELVKDSIKQKRAWVRTFGVLQQNRCVSWKKQLPTPAELNKYCGS